MSREDFFGKERFDFLNHIRMSREISIDSITSDEKKFLSEGFYFLQLFLKNQLESLDEFQKLIRYEEKTNSVDDVLNLDELYYFVDIEIYDSFFKKFPSAKTETDYFTTKDLGSSTSEDGTDPNNPIYYTGFNMYPWLFLFEEKSDYMENDDEHEIYATDVKIYAAFHRIFHDGDILAKLSLSTSVVTEDGEPDNIITIIYK